MKDTNLLKADIVIRSTLITVMMSRMFPEPDLLAVAALRYTAKILENIVTRHDKKREVTQAEFEQIVNEEYEKTKIELDFIIADLGIKS